MKAFIVDRYGKASGRLGQMPEPELRPEDVLVEVHAAGGQLAKHLGALMAATTSSSNVDFVKSLGADVVVDYKSEDFDKALQDYDAVLNSVDAQTRLAHIPTT